MAFFKKTPPPPPPKTLIGSGTSLRGKLISRNEVVLAGSISGEVVSDKGVHIEAGGMAGGRVRCSALRLDGRCEGDLAVEGLAHFAPSAVWRGDLTALRLKVDRGASLSGSLREGPVR